MKQKVLNDIKLGIFVIAGLLLLIFILYMVGKNASLFTDTFVLKARFRNVEGLAPGNNVRFSGIQAGIVKKIQIIDDTTIEVSMVVEEDLKGNIRKNSIAYLGAEGLMGNKVVNIIPNATPGEVAEEGDVLYTRRQQDLSDVLGTLYQTNDNVAVISQELLQTVRNINNSVMLQNLLNDTVLVADLRSSLGNIKASSAHINNSTVLIEGTMRDIKGGKGVLGLLVADGKAELQAAQVLDNINVASIRVKGLVARVDSIAAALELSLNNRDGLVYALLQDTAFAGRLSRSLDNVESGTAAFSEDMEALKHNFLLRGYFKKQNRKQQKNKSH